VVGPGAATDNAITRFDATTGKLIQTSVITIDDSGQVTMPFNTTPVAPAGGNIGLLAARLAGNFDVPGFIGPDGFLHTLQNDLGEFNMMRYQPQPNSSTPTGDNSLPVTATGTASTANINSSTNLQGIMRRIECLVTVAAITAVAGLRTTSNLVRVGRSAGVPGGFLARCVWGPATGAATTTSRAFAGLIPSAVPTDVEPSTQLHCVGMGWDAADANIQLMHNDGTGTATKIDLGVSFPVPTVDRSEVYEVQLYSPNSLTQEVRWRVIRYSTTDKTIAAQASGVITTDLPLVTNLLAMRAHASVGGTSSVIGVAVMGMYLATVY
jgi:hypothetical protein